MKLDNRDIGRDHSADFEWRVVANDGVALSTV